MATNYNIRLKRFNGVDYDTLNLVSTSVAMNSGNNLQSDFNDLNDALDNVLYIGNTAPTDSSVKFWLDTDEIGTSIVNSINNKSGTVTLDASDVSAMGEWELLWTNASPSSSFAEQDISLDLSEYNFVFIRYRRANDSTIQAMFSIIKISGDSGPFASFGLVDANGLIGRRIVKAYSNKINFSNGTLYSSYGSSTGTVSSTILIPIDIYGIKGIG